MEEVERKERKVREEVEEDDEQQEDEVLEQPKHHKFVLSFSRAEVEREINDLGVDRDLKLFLRVSRGQRKFERYTQLVGLLEKGRD